MSTISDAVREVLARLELQAAIIAECKMIEALASLPDADDDESDPADWPAWTDEERWEPGPEKHAQAWSSWLSRTPLID